MTYGAKTFTDKVLVILFPITAFVAAEFEHSVADMYYFPNALFIKLFDPTFIQKLSLDISALTWGSP
jgi:formate/nitrite transporter FocA (FNT family)